MTLPKAADRANKTLAFDANGNPALGISAADVANASTYATNAANSATAAASSASSASSSASSATSSASTASTQASNASTSATSASNSASSASTSATNAASSASTASTQASNASTSATNAASSASSASTSASNASTSATNASNSASAASTSASNAATSETNAAASAASAASALDSFDDRYLGSKTSNPTLDNDGNALVTGALYYRSTAPIGMKVYDGAQWIEASAAQQAALVTYEYLATAGQTTFSGADVNSLTLSYIAGGLIVSLNGSILRPGDDYTATNGTSIVLVTAASLNDELAAYAFSSFLVANTYTQAQTDSLLAAKAPLASPALTGTPTAPTAAADTNTTQLASTAHVFAERSNTATLTNKTLTNPSVNNYTEGVVAIGTVTSSSTLSLTNGTVQTATLTASTACTFTMPTAVAGKSFILLLKQAASTGNGTATFTSVKWGTTGAPTITATAGKMDILTFVSDGTNWYGSAAQGYTP